MNTMNLEKEQADLFNQIINLDSESIEKVTKYIKRIVNNRHKIKKQEAEIDDIIVSNEDIENAMCPFTHEEKMERLRLSENDPVCYSHESVQKMSLNWLR